MVFYSITIMYILISKECIYLLLHFKQQLLKCLMFSFDSNLTAYLFVQLKQMQHRMQEQLKAHQQEQLLRLQHEPQRLLGKPQNTAGM